MYAPGARRGMEYVKAAAARGVPNAVTYARTLRAQHPPGRGWLRASTRPTFNRENGKRAPAWALNSPFWGRAENLLPPLLRGSFSYEYCVNVNPECK